MKTYATWSKYWREFLSAQVESWKKLKTSICFRRLFCNKFEIDQLQCVIYRVLGNYDRITSDA